MDAAAEATADRIEGKVKLSVGVGSAIAMEMS